MIVCCNIFCFVLPSAALVSTIHPWLATSICTLVWTITGVYWILWLSKNDKICKINNARKYNDFRKFHKSSPFLQNKCKHFTQNIKSTLFPSEKNPRNRVSWEATGRHLLRHTRPFVFSIFVRGFWKVSWGKFTKYVTGFLWAENRSDLSKKLHDVELKESSFLQLRTSSFCTGLVFRVLLARRFVVRGMKKCF
jgi:hypothetical protein